MPAELQQSGKCLDGPSTVVYALAEETDNTTLAEADRGDSRRTQEIDRT